MSSFTPTNSLPLQPLTAKEKRVFEFLERYFNDHGIAPSFQEIKSHFGFASFNSVQRYLQQLQKKKYIHLPGSNQKRAITILGASSSPMLASTRVPERGPSSIPLLGRVAAGRPLEAHEHNEFIDVPLSLLRDPQKSFALKVEGQSMIEDGIWDGDIIIVKNQSQAENGDIVVAIVDNEATVKRFYFHNEIQPQIELRPANSKMKSMWFLPSDVEIRGVVEGLVRKFY